MTNLSKLVTHPIQIKWTTFIDKENKIFTTKGGNYFYISHINFS